MSNEKITTLDQLKEAISNGLINNVDSVINIIRHDRIVPFMDWIEIPGQDNNQKAEYLLKELSPKSSSTPLSVVGCSNCHYSGMITDLSITSGEKICPKCNGAKYFYVPIQPSLDAISQQTAQLRQQVEELGKQNLGASLMYAELKERNEKMERALLWYSDTGNYFGDNGELATAWKDKMDLKAKQSLNKE